MKINKKKIESIKINPRKLILTKLNARYMKHETYMRLVKNLKKDKELEQDPFCAYYEYYEKTDKIQYDEDGDPKLEVISGNHRVKAAIDAGIDEITVKVYISPLTKKERIAKQLAHNAIVGEDDPAILKQLYEMIDDVELKEYTGLDDRTLELLEKVTVESITEANIEFQKVSIYFLPSEIERIEKIIEKVLEMAKDERGWIVSQKQYDDYMNAVLKASQSMGIRSVATALMIILEIFERHLTDLSDGWDKENWLRERKRWIPLSSIIGTDCVPISAGKVIKKALKMMTSKGEINNKNLWQAIEYMAADYLSGN